MLKRITRYHIAMGAHDNHHVAVLPYPYPYPCRLLDQWLGDFLVLMRGLVYTVTVGCIGPTAPATRPPFLALGPETGGKLEPGGTWKTTTGENMVEQVHHQRVVALQTFASL
jgi:hypothetical protein